MSQHTQDSDCTIMQARLTALKNYATRYEAVVTDGATSYLLAYICGRSFRHLLTATQKRVESVNAATHSQAFVENRKIVAGSFEIKYSGRTQRECIMHGELPYIAKVGGK